MNIQEGNKVIAEFMGINVKQINDNEIVVGKRTYRKGHHQTDSDFNCDWVWELLTNPNNSGSFKYHTSWDWLMPVVEKINVTKVDGERYDVIIYRTTCHINDERQILVETSSKGSLIETVWEAVVQFITWYNTQQH